MPTNTDPAAVTNMVRRCADLKCTCDDNGFCPKCASGKLEGSGECECPARKALKRNREGYLNILQMRKLSGADWGERDGYGGRYGALTREEIEAVVAENNAALSAPCPCEGLRADEPSAEAWKELVRWAHGADRSQEGVRLIYEITTHYLAMRRERDSLRAENERLKRSLDWITAEKHGAQTDAEREKNVADSLRAELAAEKERSANLEMARDIAQERADRIEAASWNALKLAQSLHDLSLKSGADLAASQERERLLREALALAESWVVADGAHGRADRPDIDASRSSRRAKAIDQINEAFRLATPEGTVRP